MLGLSKECKKCEAKITVGVPVAVVATELQVTGDSKSAGSSSYKYPCDIDASKIASLDFEVAGVLAENVLNSYSSSESNVIYLPIDTMAEIQKDTQHSVSTSGNQGLLEWRPSSYMLYADKYSDVKPIISKIQTIGFPAERKKQLPGRGFHESAGRQ